MSELIYTIDGAIANETVKSSLDSPLPVASAFSYVYVGVNGGMERSAEGNSNWTTEVGITGKVTSLCYHSGDGFLYAGTDGGRLYRKNTFDGAWSQIGSAQSTRFNDMVVASGDNILIAGNNGTIYISDGSTLSAEFASVETSVKSVAYYKNKAIASTTGGKIYDKVGAVWSLQKQLSGDSIGYVWRFIEHDGRLTGVGDNGYHYMHNGYDWWRQKITDGVMFAHASYLDREVAANISGDIFFYENKLWKKKLALGQAVLGLGQHKGRLLATVSGDNYIERINFFQVDDLDSWSESNPVKAGILGGVRRDGGISDKRQYKDIATTLISGIMHKSTYALMDTRLKLLQQATNRKEIKLWFEDDKFKYGILDSISKSPFTPTTIQSYNINIFHNDPYRYGNQYKFKAVDIAWADEAIGVSQISGDTNIEFGNSTFNAIAQVFVAEQSTLSKAIVKSGTHVGTPSGDVVCTLRDLNLTVLDTVTVASGDWAATTEITLDFEYAPLQIGQEYMLMMSGDQPVDNNNHRRMTMAKLSDEYGAGYVTQYSGDSVSYPISSGDLWFKLYHTEKSALITNAGNAFAQPRIKFRALSGDMINTRVTNQEADLTKSYFRYAKTLVQDENIIFDSQQRQILTGINNAANFFTGDFIEFAPGVNTVTVQGAPARYEIEFRDTYL